MNYIGDFAEDETIYTMFNTFTSDDPSASCTITNFVNTDVHIHKDDGLTQRNNAAGITVLANFDTITGSHMVKIDTNDNTVAGFWVAGHDYFVRIEGTTVDGATINATVCHFSIENRFMRGTDSAALATVCTEARLAELRPVEVVENIFDYDMGLWTEVDTPGRVTIDYSNERIAIADLDSDENVYVYKATDVNVEDFILDFEFQVFHFFLLLSYISKILMDPTK